MILDSLILCAVIVGLMLFIKIGRQSTRNRLVRYFLISIGFFIILSFLLHQLRPGLFPSYLVIWKVEYILLLSVISLLAGMRTRVVKSSRERRLFAIFLSLGLFLTSFPFLLRPFMRVSWRDSEPSFVDGVCLQQASYSCGAASISTVLKHHGYEFSEGEAVIATWTVPLLGTEPDMLASGIESLTHDALKSSVRRTPFAEIARERLPCIVALYWGGLVSHYVVLYQLTPKTAVIGDPLVGSVEYPVSWFSGHYRGYLISVSPKATRK